MIRQLIAGNWKMNGLQADLSQIVALRDGVAAGPLEADILVCPPATLIRAATSFLGDSPIFIGAQDCHTNSVGAHTGDISAEMLADAGATHVIVGHSERRWKHGEADETVRAKAKAAMDAGLSPIICVGETEDERKAGKAMAVVERQLLASMPRTTDGFAVAYEPVWAIGTGKTPTHDDIADMHRHIRAHLGRGTRILYGGSVKPANAAEILAIENVNGALVGGASLKADDFAAIINAAKPA